MPKKREKLNWASIAQIRALQTPTTEHCGKPTKEIIIAIKQMEHNEKVDKAKRRYCCNT